MSKNAIDTLSVSEKSMKVYEFLSFSYYMVALIALLFSARLVKVHVPFSDYTIIVSASTWIIPLTFFFQDIICEAFGYAKAIRVLNTTSIMLIFVLIYGKLVSFMPSPDIQNITNEYTVLFNTLPRHFIALFIALTIGSQFNITLLSYLKVWRWFSPITYRIIGSSLVGIIVYQLVGTSIAWWGKLSLSDLLPFMIFSILYKIIFEILLTPVCVIIINAIKLVDDKSPAYDS